MKLNQGKSALLGEALRRMDRRTADALFAQDRHDQRQLMRRVADRQAGRAELTQAGLDAVHKDCAYCADGIAEEHNQESAS